MEAFVNVKGVGDVQVKTSKGNKLSNILYIPELRMNLLSITQMMEKNFSLKFSSNTCTIFYPIGCEVLKVPMINKKFIDKFNDFVVDKYGQANGSSLEHKKVNKEKAETSESQQKKEKLEPMKTSIWEKKEKNTMLRMFN